MKKSKNMQRVPRKAHTEKVNKTIGEGRAAIGYPKPSHKYKINDDNKK